MKPSKPQHLVGSIGKRVWLAISLVAIALAVRAITVSATEPKGGASAGPVTVELFTSQSCYSCPPAEALLGKLAGRADLVALEFHVDYWNDLVYGLAGRWTDVHSDPAYSARQRAYAARLTNSIGGGVYTPQMVIDGRTQAVGSREREVEAAIASVRTGPRLTVSLVARDAGKAELRVAGAEGVSHATAEIVLVRFKRKEETRVRAGENRGKTLVNHHIVTGLTSVGPLVLDGGSTVLDTGGRGHDEGCAVLIQAGAGPAPGLLLGPILGAAYCPASPENPS